VVNPYEVLGIRKNATKRAIEKAFRKKVKAAHPDMGGSREQFAEVHIAYKILTDDGRRARYDSTGEYEDFVPDNQMACSIEIISVALQQVLATVHPSQRTKCDPVPAMKRHIGEQISAGKQALKQHREALEAYKPLHGRFTVKDGPNFMDMLLVGLEASLANRVKELEFSIPRFERALADLEKVTFRVDGTAYMQPAPFGRIMWAQSGATASSS
jgi:curved DNA-binding protein CbpA